MSDEAQTRRESATTVTRRENGAAPTRREEDAAGWAGVDLTALPDALRARLSDLRPMQAGGGEAQLVRVHDAALPGRDRVLKIYFPQIAPDAKVAAQLSRIRSRHVVEVVETGTLVDGRFYELMEYLPRGSLRDVGAGKHAFDTGSVTEMVRQLADGLGVLHGLGIVHRDLKPENVLVRDGSPVQLVLTDFGLSRSLNATSHFTTAARTSAYAAPEAWSKHVSQARDWWSLGIMVLELVTGEQPFHGLDDMVIQMAVSTKPVSVDAVTEPRLARLCAGLLVSDQAKRWGAREVGQWLAGGSPAVPDRRVPIAATEFEFAGERYTDPEALAAAMSSRWRLAARRYGTAPSAHWSALTTWLHQFDDPGRSATGVVEARLDLLTELESSAEVPDVKLVRLLAGLNPKLPPIYRGEPVDAATLRELARQAQDLQDPKCREATAAIEGLWGGKVLGVLARFDDGGATELAAIEARWATGAQELNAAMNRLRNNKHLPASWPAKHHRSAALAGLLERAAGAPRGDDWVRELRQAAQQMSVPVDWFERLVVWAGADPVRSLAALHAAGPARAEADKVVRSRQATERARLARENAWAAHEQTRLASRGGAAGRAVGGVAVLAGLWLVVALVTIQTPVVGLVLLGVVGAHAAVELVLAHALAGDYHPAHSLLQAVQHAGGRVGARMRGASRQWALGIVVLVVLVGFVPWLALAAALGAVTGHGVWTSVRHRRWSQAHDQYRRQVLHG